MKRLLLFSFLLASLTGFADNVATTPQPRHVLVEDFTGIHCGNCPDAHEILDHLRVAQPELVHSVAIHAGAYATPGSVDQPDYRTVDGQLIHDNFGINSYPSGLVNRMTFSEFGGLKPSRSYWTRCARMITKETADVNIWAKATYNATNRKVTVDVELYYVNGIEANGSTVSVALLQNGIIGPQAGAEDVIEYEHNHMLRDMITPTWGDTIATSTAGTLVKKSYEYTLPEAINEVETDPFNSDILVYVARADEAQNNEVLNSAEVPLNCTGLTMANAVKLESYKIPVTRNYGFEYLECYVTNMGNETLTKLGFTTQLNENQEVATTVDVNIAPREKAVVQVPVDWKKQNGSDNEYTLKVVSYNGTSLAEQPSLKGEFADFVYVKGQVKVKIKTDNYASENTYRVLNQKGEIVKEFGPYDDGEQTTYDETFTVNEGEVLCFEIQDAWGDGVMSPRGSVYWYDSEDNQLAWNNNIQNYGYRVFFKYGVAGEEEKDPEPEPEPQPDPEEEDDPTHPDFSKSVWGIDGEYGMLVLPAGTNEYGTEQVMGVDGTLWFFTYSPESDAVEDIRTTTYNMYLQAVDKMGNKKFGEKGLLISNYPNRSYTEIGQYIHANRDSTVTVAIPDCRNTEAQGYKTFTGYRFRPDGTSVWDRDGVNLDEGETYMLCCGMSIIELTDGTNVFSWMRSATYSGSACYIERCHVSKEGKKLNALADLRLGSRESDVYEYPMLVAGDDNTYYLTYGRTSSLVIYVQKFNGDGSKAWSDTYGKKIYAGGWGSTPILQTRIKCYSDGKGGIVIGWNGDSTDPYHAWIAWVKPDGTLGYTNSEGKAQMRLSYEEILSQHRPDIIPSPDGNGFLATFSAFNMNYQQYQTLYVQHIDSIGNLLYGEEGLELVPLGEHSIGYTSIQPGKSGEFLVAYEMVVGTAAYNNVLNYFVRLNAKDGSPADPEQGDNGVVCMSTKQYYRACLETVTNAQDGYWILHWEQYYKGPNETYDRASDPNDPTESLTHHCLAAVTFDGTIVNWLKDFTGIESIDNKPADNLPMYNLSGLKVGKNYKGIVIQGNKKYLMR